MRWHSAKSKERPDHMDTCICVLPRNKGIITTFYDKENDQFITKDDYGDHYSIIEIKAWVTEYELVHDCKESLKSKRKD